MDKITSGPTFEAIKQLGDFLETGSLQVFEAGFGIYSSNAREQHFTWGLHPDSYRLEVNLIEEEQYNFLIASAQILESFTEEGRDDYLRDWLDLPEDERKGILRLSDLHFEEFNNPELHSRLIQAILDYRECIVPVIKMNQH